MTNDKELLMKKLEEKIENMVREIISEKKKISKDNKTAKKDSYKSQYKAIKKALSDKKVNATGVMSKALGIDLTKDDAQRSKAFKKLHQEETPDGNSNYSFDRKEVNAIFNEIS